MKSIVLLSTVAAFTLVAGVASAATLTNTDKNDVKVSVDINGKKEEVSLKEHQSFDSKGKEAAFILGTEKPVIAKGHEHLEIKDGKIIETPKSAKVETKATGTEAKTEVKTDVEPSAGKMESAAPVETAPATK